MGREGGADLKEGGSLTPIPLPSRKRRRRAAYVLPTLFTSGNIFLGFLSLMQSFQGATVASSGNLGWNPHFALAAKALGFAIFFDGLDGRIARMTNTTSDFGRELDSLADFIAFGIAPAMLAFVWGVRYVALPANSPPEGHLIRAGYMVVFLYLLCGAVRLARFNVQTNPIPKNPGRPDRKYFVGMPSPAAAALIASIVFFEPSPVRSFAFSIFWLVVVGVTGLLMVSTWRYPSFKQVTVLKPRTPLIVLLVGGIAFLIWEWSQPFLLAAATTYVFTGIVLRIGGLIRRYRRVRPGVAQPEHQVG
jgi:CDP-diacylglycerol--serine O-phosphatidyltransferase